MSGLNYGGVETCRRIGKEPRKDYSGKMVLRVSPEIHRKGAQATG